ncbi:MAG: SpoVR family protein [Firmicutes bacterium]|nr:SpoVR family protein [Bacillota bacterium]
MADYTLAELAAWGERIEELAREEGLNFYPQEFELCNYEDMLCYQAYTGMPSHYPHWSFGKAYEKLKTLYKYNISGLPYEMVINANPCIAYLMKENSLLLQILTMAHVYGHNDFFRNNRLFTAGTRAELTVETFKNHARRVREYAGDPSIGYERVEQLLNAAHALRFQTNRVVGEDRLSYEEYYRRKYRSEQERTPDHPLLEEARAPGDTNGTAGRKRRIPPQPEEDILWFITEYGDLEEWEKDVINIVREETAYFLPQIETKIMNEGWASFWHYLLLCRLDLPEKLRWEFYRYHNQVIRPTPGGLNPYHIGYVIFKYLYEQQGKEKIFEAREVEKDQSFLRRYLNLEICKELELFEYMKKRDEYIVKEIADEEGWKSIRSQLVKTTGLGAIPVIRIVEYRPLDHHLLLEHEYDGRDLEMNYTTETLRYCAELWKGKVTLKTRINKEERIIHCDEKSNLSILL